MKGGAKNEKKEGIVEAAKLDYRGLAQKPSTT
jgi:hypothetical protein